MLGLGLGLTSPAVLGGGAPDLSFPAVVWTDLTGADISAPGNGVLSWTGTDSPTGAKATTVIDATQPFEVRALHTSPAVSDTLVMALTENEPLNFEWINEVMASGWSTQAAGGPRLFLYNAEASIASVTSMAGSYPIYVRAYKDGDDLVYEESEDQETWSSITTHSGVLSGVTSLYLSCVHQSPANGDEIQVFLE